MLAMEEPTEKTVGLQELRRRIAAAESARRRQGGQPLASGCPPLDELLPERGFRPGTLVEWIKSCQSPFPTGTGAGTLALLAAREACRGGGLLAVLDQRREFFPLAAVRLGIEPEQLVVVHTPSTADNDWAMDQVLRSPAMAAVLAWPQKLDGRTFRRWQLAAEEGDCLGLLLRPETARGEPSWADVRLSVEPVCDLPSATGVASYSPGRRRLRIVVLRCRGNNCGRSIDVELDDETHCVHPVAKRRWQIAN
jgi:protein ImuA